jgi:hypothetical protein
MSIKKSSYILILWPITLIQLYIEKIGVGVSGLILNKFPNLIIINKLTFTHKITKRVHGTYLTLKILGLGFI